MLLIGNSGVGKSCLLFRFAVRLKFKLLGRSLVRKLRNNNRS
ncbi:MAG: hypothetical protein ACK56F_26730 [bacterium]